MSLRKSLSGISAVGRVETQPVPQTSAHILRPVSDISGVGTDVTAAWTPNTGSAIWSVLDDAVTQPTAGSPAVDDFASFSGSGPATYVGKLAPASNMSSGEAVTSVTLWALISGQSGTVGSITVNLLRGDGSTLAAGTADTSTSATPRWVSVTFNGTLLHSAVDALRFSVVGSNTLNTGRIYTAYAAVNVSGAAGGIYDGPAQVYGDRNPPETLMQTKTTEPAVPGSGLAINYVLASDNIPRTKTDTGVVTRMITQAEYDRTVPRVAIPTSAVAIAGSTAEQALTSITIPANTIVAGTVVRIILMGTMTQSAASVTTTWRVRAGSAVLGGNIAASTALATAAAAKTTVPFVVEALVTFRTNGASGTVIGGVSPDGILFQGGAVSTASGVTAAVAANTTADLLVGLTLQNSATTMSGTVQSAITQVLQP